MRKNQLHLADHIVLTDEATARVIAHLGGDGSDFIVSDLMERDRYNRPDRIGVKREGRGLSIGVQIADIVARGATTADHSYTALMVCHQHSDTCYG